MMADELVRSRVGLWPWWAPPQTQVSRNRGFGYIKVGQALAWVGTDERKRLAHNVDRFVESPMPPPPLVMCSPAIICGINVDCF